MRPAGERKERGDGMTKLFTVWMLMQTSALARRNRASERGDVPGWVLITVMTAGLVAALWAVAGPQLAHMVSTALSSVKS
jgi:hypothetical protein